jgi:hypothetical protein
VSTVTARTWVFDNSRFANAIATYWLNTCSASD